jgi:ferrous-iron efflux pump FieF
MPSGGGSPRLWRMHISTAGENADKERATQQAVVAGALDTAVTLGALLAASSSVLLADFLKTSLEFVAVMLAWLSLRRIIHGRNHAFDYGIGKLESLSSVFVGVLMMLGVLVIVVNAVLNLLNPSHISGVGVYISAVAQLVFGAINTRMAWNARRLARQSASPIIAAQQQLFTSRAVGNAFIFLSLSLSMLLHDQAWSVYIDPIASLIVAGFIAFSAMGVFADSFNDLLDKTLDEELQLLITRELVEHFDQYEHIHGIRSRRSGSQVFIDIFLECAADRKVGEVQAFFDTLRTGLESKIPNSRVVVGLAGARVS